MRDFGVAAHVIEQIQKTHTVISVVKQSQTIICIAMQSKMEPGLSHQFHKGRHHCKQTRIQFLDWKKKKKAAVISHCGHQLESQFYLLSACVWLEHNDLNMLVSTIHLSSTPNNFKTHSSKATPPNQNMSKNLTGTQMWHEEKCSFYYH